MLGSMRVRQIGAVAGVLLGGIGCMKTDRVVAVQMDMNMDGGEDVALGDVALGDVALGDVALGDDAWVWRPFSTPTPVTGLVSNTTDAHGPSLVGDDELEIYLACEELGGTTFNIYSSTRTAIDARWNPAKLVLELSGSGNDQDPDVSYDGLTIYFASDRPVPGYQGYQLYVSHRDTRAQKWLTPVLVQGDGFSSSTLYNRGPSVNPSGLFMAFFSAPLNTEDDSLYSASRTDPLGAWGNVQELSGINSREADADPALFHDSVSLIWSSRGPSKGKSWDLVEVSRPDASTPFSSAAQIPLDSLNTDLSERYPWVSQDGTHIMFTREAVGGAGQIYEAWR
jgi:hypothetical protein